MEQPQPKQTGHLKHFGLDKVSTTSVLIISPYSANWGDGQGLRLMVRPVTVLKSSIPALVALNMLSICGGPIGLSITMKSTTMRAMVSMSMILGLPLFQATLFPTTISTTMVNPLPMVRSVQALRLVMALIIVLLIISSQVRVSKGIALL